MHRSGEGKGSEQAQLHLGSFKHCVNIVKWSVYQAATLQRSSGGPSVNLNPESPPHPKEVNIFGQ